MKITAVGNVDSKKILSSALVGGAAAVTALVSDNNKKTQSKNLNKDFGIWGRVSSAEFQATQNISKIDGFKINPNNKIYVLSGSSGVGKDTILRTFLSKHPEFKLSVSHTTREIRPGEVDGVDYYFVKDEDFHHGMVNDEFLEWAVFSGNYYGTKKASLQYMLNKTNNVILKLDTKGALKVKKLIPEAVLIFVAPPSIQELEARLRGRNTESEESIKRRLSAIKTEMKNAEKFDYQIVNDKIDNAVESLEKILCPKKED